MEGEKTRAWKSPEMRNAVRVSEGEETWQGSPRRDCSGQNQRRRAWRLSGAALEMPCRYPPQRRFGALDEHCRGHNYPVRVEDSKAKQAKAFVVCRDGNLGRGIRCSNRASFDNITAIMRTWNRTPATNRSYVVVIGVPHSCRLQCTMLSRRQP